MLYYSDRDQQYDLKKFSSTDVVLINITLEFCSHSQSTPQEMELLDWKECLSDYHTSKWLHSSREQPVDSISEEVAAAIAGNAEN